MRRKNLLPEGFRIVEVPVASLNPADLYESTFQLERWEEKTKKFLWWKRVKRAWVPIERSTNERRLMQTARLMEKNA